MSAKAPRENVPTAVAKNPASDVLQNSPSTLDVRLSTFQGALIFVAIALLIYWPLLRAGFIWDDDLMLTENPLIKIPDGLSQIWFSTNQSDYFPLTYTSLWIEWRFFGI